MNYSQIIKKKWELIKQLQEAANDANIEAKELTVLCKKAKEEYLKSYHEVMSITKQINDIYSESKIKNSCDKLPLYDQIIELSDKLKKPREESSQLNKVYIAKIKNIKDFYSEIKKAYNQIIILSDEVEALSLLRDRENFTNKISTRCI